MILFKPNINDRVANYEFLAAIICSVGMISMVVLPVIGKLLILLGLVGLIILYILQFVDALDKKKEERIVPLSLKQISMIIILAGMMLTILGTSYNLYILILGWSMMIINCIVTYKESRLMGAKIISVQQIRNFILAMVSVVFFIGF
jgi:hypothetical protein